MPALILLTALILVAFAPPSAPPTGADVLRRMHARLSRTAARPVAAVKQATFADGRIQRWYESIQPPGLRRLDLTPLDSMNGLLFRADSLYEIARGLVTGGRPLVHAQTLLTYDVYAAPPSATADRLTRLGFDLSRVSETVWQGRPTYVVGGREADRQSNQFWIDQRRLCLVRLIERRAEGSVQSGDPPLIQESWLSRHALLGGVWLPAEVTYFRNGRQFLREVIQWRGQPALPTEAFLPQPWRKADWFPPAAIGSR